MQSTTFRFVIVAEVILLLVSASPTKNAMIPSIQQLSGYILPENQKSHLEKNLDFFDEHEAHPARQQTADLNKVDACPHIPSVKGERKLRLLNFSDVDWGCCPCLKGKKLAGPCRKGEPNTTECVSCEPGSYIDRDAHEEKECFTTDVTCDSDTEVYIPLQLTSAPECHCRQDKLLYRASNGSCVPHSACPPGEGVKAIGTPFGDTICEICAPSYESPNWSRTEICKLKPSVKNHHKNNHLPSRLDMSVKSVVANTTPKAETTQHPISILSGSKPEDKGTWKIIVGVASFVALLIVCLVICLTMCRDKIFCNAEIPALVHDIEDTYDATLSAANKVREKRNDEVIERDVTEESKLVHDEEKKRKTKEANGRMNVRKKIEKLKRQPLNLKNRNRDKPRTPTLSVHESPNPVSLSDEDAYFNSPETSGQPSYSKAAPTKVSAKSRHQSIMNNVMLELSSRVSPEESEFLFWNFSTFDSLQKKQFLDDLVRSRQKPAQIFIAVFTKLEEQLLGGFNPHTIFNFFYSNNRNRELSQYLQITFPEAFSKTDLRNDQSELKFCNDKLLGVSAPIESGITTMFGTKQSMNKT